MTARACAVSRSAAGSRWRRPSRPLLLLAWSASPPSRRSPLMNGDVAQMQRQLARDGSRRRRDARRRPRITPPCSSSARPSSPRFSPAKPMPTSSRPLPDAADAAPNNARAAPLRKPMTEVDGMQHALAARAQRRRRRSAIARPPQVLRRLGVNPGPLPSPPAAVGGPFEAVDARQCRSRASANCSSAGAASSSSSRA